MASTLIRKTSYMTQLKLPSFRRASRRYAWLVIASLMMLPLLSVLLATPKAEAAAVDCSDVFTPLSSYVVNGVAANKAFYVQAMNETGVPWEMLAAVHYRETNFSHTNPANGQGIFQFVSGAGGPYPAGLVSDTEFYRQLKYMANKIQTDYALRNAPSAANVTPRALTPNDQDINLIKNTLFSYNGRSSLYAAQAATYGYDSAKQPYEGSPYVMNRFDCPRARMGIITQDFGVIDSTDTRYGAFTVFARLRGESYWLAMTQQYSWVLNTQEIYNNPERTWQTNTAILSPGTTYYMRVTARNMGSSTWTNSGLNPVKLATTSPMDRASAFCDPSWSGCNRPAVLKEASVAPGEIGTFEFTIKAPAGYGSYSEYFNLVAEGKAWMSDIGMYYQLAVSPPVREWMVAGQEAYTDAARTLPLNPDALTPNTTYYFRVRALNTGNTTWTNSGPNPVNLSTAGPDDRNSLFCTAGWSGCNRPAQMIESSTAPGQLGTFEFAAKSPSAYGVYKEYFNLVSEGVSRLKDIGFYWQFNVRPPIALWQYQGQAYYTDATKSASFNTSQTPNGSLYYVVANALNSGNTTWSNSGPNPVLLGTSNPKDRASAFYDSSWAAGNRPAVLKQSTVVPGQIGTFEFWMRAPNLSNGTVSNEYFQSVVEGSSWMNDIGFYVSTLSQTPDTNWQYLSQGAYSDSARTTAADLSNSTVNTTYYLQLKIKNTSGISWSNTGANPLRLGTANPNDRTSVFYDSSWSGSNRAATLKEPSVAPGQTGTFEFSITTPSSPISTQEYFQPVLEGKTWLQDIGLNWAISTH